MIKNLFKKYSENKIKKQKIRKQILGEIEKHESEMDKSLKDSGLYDGLVRLSGGDTNASLESLNESFDEIFKDIKFPESSFMGNLVRDMRNQKILNFVFRNGKLSLAYLKKFVEDKNKNDISITALDKYKFEIKKNKIYINNKIFKKPESILNELKNMKKLYKKDKKFYDKQLSLVMAYDAKLSEIYPHVEIDTEKIDDSFFNSVYPKNGEINDMEDILEKWSNSDDVKNISNKLDIQANFIDHMTKPSKKINKTFIKKLLKVRFVSIRTPRSSLEIEDGKVTISGKKIKGDEKLIETLKDIKNNYIKNKKILDDDFEKIRKKMKLDIKS